MRHTLLAVIVAIALVSCSRGPIARPADVVYEIRYEVYGMGNAFVTYDDEISRVVDRVIDLPWELSYKIRMREIEPGRDIRITVRERADNRSTGADLIGCRIFVNGNRVGNDVVRGPDSRVALCVFNP